MTIQYIVTYLVDILQVYGDKCNARASIFT